MKIALLIGHCILHSKDDISSLGYISEYQYVKELTPYICDELNNNGYECDLIAVPEYLLNRPIDELLYKIPRVNLKDDNGQYRYDLAIELHLNYSNNPLKHGVRVYYKPGDCFGYRMAERVCKYYSLYNFFNLGVNTPPLHILQQSKISTLVVELYYCTSKIDVRLSKKYGLKKMAEIFVEAINDGPYKTSLTGNCSEFYIKSKHGWAKTPNGVTYYNQSIQYVNTIENIHGDYYYFNPKGYLSTGWKKIRGNIYYFDPNNGGKMIIDDTIYINRQKYRFDYNGKLLTVISPENIEYYTEDQSCEFTIDGNIVIYPDDLDLHDIALVHDKYPNDMIVRKSDYDNYNIKFTNEILVNKES